MHHPAALLRRRAAAWGGALLCAASLLLAPARPADAGVLMQGFYWDVPSPAADSPQSPWWWDNLAAQANEMKRIGFTAVWIPPVHKGAAGGYSVGYDPHDDYDLGSKNQMGTVPTRYGTREQLQRCVAMMRANGLDVYLDLVLNHRNGDDGFYNFRHVDAYGNWPGGRFQKGPLDFHPQVPQDPLVWDGDSEQSFGRRLAPVNGAGGWIDQGLKQAGDWLTKALDIQGYRLDYVKGVSASWLTSFLNHGAMANKFAVGEFFDSNVNSLRTWKSWTGDRAAAFDFALREELQEMCQGGGFYDMRRLDRAGLTGIDPLGSVTFVENHDTDTHDPITRNKLMAYAYILTAEGYPCVFYRDWSTQPGSYGAGLRTGIDNLVWIHEKLASGGTQERWKDADLFVFERTGGSRLLVGMNDNGAASRGEWVQTGFGPNVRLNDYTGNMPPITTNQDGWVFLTVPSNANGRGYVAYSREGLGGTTFEAPQLAVTQEFAGATDLDIRPADSTQTVQVARVWAQGGRPISLALFWDGANWNPNTGISLSVAGPTGATLATRAYSAATPQGTTLTALPGRTGWYALRIRSSNTSAANPRPAYWLRATYTAPQK